MAKPKMSCHRLHSARPTAKQFILRIQRAGTECRHIRFYLINAKTRKLGKQCNANRFGFFVMPQDALDVLKLIGKQAEADNTKHARGQVAFVTLRERSATADG